jgi:hypothetical protein
MKYDLSQPLQSHHDITEILLKVALNGNSPQRFKTLSGKNALIFVFIQNMLLTNLTCI